MTDKILVDVYLPAADCNYDVYIPLKSKMYEVAQLLSGIITDLSNGYFTANSDVSICDRKTGTVFDINLSVEELNLQNGSKLMIL
jgi:hypothetical protein